MRVYTRLHRRRHCLKRRMAQVVDSYRKLLRRLIGTSGAMCWVPRLRGWETQNLRRENTMNTMLLKLYVKFQDLASREEGQDLVEYALVVALIAFGATAGMKALATGLNSAFSNISSTLGSYVS